MRKADYYLVVIDGIHVLLETVHLNITGVVQQKHMKQYLCGEKLEVTRTELPADDLDRYGSWEDAGMFNSDSETMMFIRLGRRIECGVCERAVELITGEKNKPVGVIDLA